uniref:PUM-HD domain-containing protein n=1 Tax=Amphora coffeiformis TaxID=265554 RepID=A0A7S3KX64_9STRA|mmetsp:Transcript_9760/g.18671  ORF Transcript_9760/g.18671 Transcript_9760/m.18671 type:complete len:900 (-) Transcript_9760:235-2934(-)|eukprot:scaffold31592_cov173-Amphora_coffeaeformis.AAC.2
MSGEEAAGSHPASTENGVVNEEKMSASSLEAKGGSSDEQVPAEDTPTNGGSAQVEDSLGAALAGMNLGGASVSDGTAGVSSSFLSGGDAGGTPGDTEDTWGSFATDIAAASPANFASDQGGTNESLQLFLSRDPSQTLGENVFKLSHPNLPALDQQGLSSGDTASAFRLQVEGASANGGGMTRSNFGEIRRRTESPSAATNGTNASSRSNSPYHEAARTIQAYQPFEPASSSDDRSTSGYSLNQPSGANSLNTSLDGGIPRSPYAKTSGSPYAPSPGGGVIGGAYDYDRAGGSVFADPSQPQPQPGQVLYMAVPSPDGRGRVLQPVQMVQLPGKQMAYVVAGGPQFEGGSPAPDTANPMMGLPQYGADPYGAPPVGVPNQNGAGRNPYIADTMQHRSFDASLGARDEYSRGGAAQFQPDPAVASLYAAPQRPPLDALLGQVRRLSRDQVGCRLVQQALDEEGPMAATLILQEGLPFWGEAMVDPFGNYLFQKILEKVTPEERIMLVKSVSTRLVNASLNLHGTRSVQKIVELCAMDQQNEADTSSADEETAAEILTKALAPAAARLCIDSHGNHVIQRIILKLGPKYSDFVFDAVAASVGDVARHRHGCCVIQRCLDSSPSEARSHLVRRIVDKSLELMQDAYGNYVVQYVLDVCSDDDVHAVCESVVGKVNLLAIQKFSSNVMEKCLERCTERVKEQYMAEISNAERIRELMMDPFGNYVVQRALSVATHAQAVRLVEAMKPHLIATQTGGPNGQRNGGVRNTAGGRRIIAKICRRFPNFTLNQVGGVEETAPSPHRGGDARDDPYNRPLGGGGGRGHGYNHRSHDHHTSPAQHNTMAYNPGPSYMADPHYGLGHMGMQQQPPQQQQQPRQQQQQQSYYNFGGGPYYDPFTTGGGYGM